MGIVLLRVFLNVPIFCNADSIYLILFYGYFIQFANAAFGRPLLKRKRSH